MSAFHPSEWTITTGTSHQARHRHGEIIDLHDRIFGNLSTPLRTNITGRDPFAAIEVVMFWEAFPESVPET
ncbi:MULTISPECIES: hypothetical protein [Pseudomonadota]|uniref:hypothetical protein n=1 Tax=Pseudomonadota TaxID=1224 RepID=UPI00098D3E72|nr:MULTISPECIES: hypothetical protein [Pseudomonadota]AQT08256.1 hypothetical protein H78_01556 [Pseudomonas protegens]MDX3996989.1 hypothetical protein [Pseudomonas aeruginosa]MEB2543976.1 hypothetical protein [Burkholderia cenocepacia]GED76259.1 hypothetical protein PFL02_31090 [Pseudomonas fluorescens]